MQMAEMLESEAALLAGVGGSQRDALDGIERTDTFIKAVLGIAGRFEDGATYDDIREAILKSPLGDKYKKSDKGFYTALAKLKHRGELVDRNGYVFTPANLAIYQRKVAAGLKPEKSRVPASEKRESPLYDLALNTIARTPGLIAKDVIGQIRAESDLGRTLTDNENSAYNAIARLKKRGVIEGYGRLERQLRIGANAPEEYKRIASAGVVVHLAKRTEAPSGTAGASGAGPLFGIAPRR
ncbi:hypothetical protein [Sphingomonas oligophenolica]|uniref:hypothetical protein n=1 Tax=Sphingomonas oligophenolica TaxID=301154 RepID=UPI0019D5CBA2|nr:hypothetical protein [Sphingomonas oligophenolica]